MKGCSPAKALRLLASVSFALVLAAAAARAETIRVGPSAFCHVTDGGFTDCTGAPGVEEWSDIDYLPWADANVYTDQSTSPPTLHLMYDLINRHTPLGSAESFDINFDVVEDGQLVHYLVRVFGNNTAQIFEDGVLQTDPEGIQGAVGFGINPIHPGFFDVFVELKVPMNVVYSPDIPLFWSTAAPKDRCTQPGSPGCGGDGTATAAAVLPGQVPVSQSIVSAGSDGSTVVTRVPFGATTADFCNPATGAGLLGDLIDALLPAASVRNHGDFASQVTAKSKQAVATLVNSGVITRAQGDQIHGCVVSSRARGNTGKK
ncbi:MAG TPA: hypothetical protein VJ866_16025 [Pyrinomonadaceae bacterium]|nr:hypothetical protein [Pyrinomonadaceae bacterium]